MWLGSQSCAEESKIWLGGWRRNSSVSGTLAGVIQKNWIPISLIFQQPGRSSCEDLLFLWNPAELSLSYFHPCSPIYTLFSIPEQYSASASLHRWLTHFTLQLPSVAAWLRNVYLNSFGEQGCKSFNKIQTETLYPLIVSAKNRQQISLLRFTLYILGHTLVGLSFFPVSLSTV